MSQQSVIAQRDPHPIEGHTEDRQRDPGPAKQPGDERGQGRQMDRHDRDDVQPDHPVGTNGRRDRANETGPAPAPVGTSEDMGSTIVVGDEPRLLMSDRSSSTQRLFLETAFAEAVDTACMRRMFSSWARGSGLLSTIARRVAIKCLCFSTLYHGTAPARTQGTTELVRGLGLTIAPGTSNQSTKSLELVMS